jgi:hypothetical protein
VDLTFRFPSLRRDTRDIVIISDPSMRRRAEDIGYGLAKLGFPLSFETTMTTVTGSIESTHINIYWHDELRVGIAPDAPRLLALRHIDESIPYTTVERNEYISTIGPKIEIVIGKDAGEYFTFLKNPYYLPIIVKSSVSGE